MLHIHLSVPASSRMHKLKQQRHIRAKTIHIWSDSVLSPSSDRIFIWQSIFDFILGEALFSEILLFLPVILALLLCLALVMVRLALLGQQPAQLIWQLSIVLLDDLCNITNTAVGACQVKARVIASPGVTVTSGTIELQQCPACFIVDNELQCCDVVFALRCMQLVAAEMRRFSGLSTFVREGLAMQLGLCDSLHSASTEIAVVFAMQRNAEMTATFMKLCQRIQQDMQAGLTSTNQQCPTNNRY